MQLTQGNIDFLFYGLQQRFGGAFTRVKPLWPAFATQTTSSTRQEVYAWLDRMPKMREWLGERQLLNLSSRSYVLPNKDYEATLELDRNVILDDQFGIYNGRADMLGMQAAMWPDDLMTAALQNGDSTAALCYDGQPFFSANHPTDPDNPASAVQSNLYTTAGSGATPLTAANFNLVRSKLIAWQGTDARPIGVVPDLLIVPPALEVTARQILQATFIAPTAAVGQNAANTVQGNVLTGMADILVNPRLAGQDTTWYLADTKTIGAVVRPLIFQQRQAPVFVQKTSPTDENLFRAKKLLWGVDSRGNAGYTLPFLMVKCGP